jgi:hypothetical protein
MHVARTLVLTLIAAVPGARAAAPSSVRLLSNGKDAAQVEVHLDAPAPVTVHAGEIPGEWSITATSAEASEDHVVTLGGLAPDRRYFYQVEVDGEPGPDMLTFVSGRSWVTRHAVLLVTAAVPSESAEDRSLADALFASEADALLLLGGPGEGDALKALHGRAMTDRLVAAVGEPGASESLKVADVAVAWGAGSKDALDAAKDACWKVVAGDAEGANVVLEQGKASAISATTDRLDLSLAGRAWAKLSFVDGTLTATLHREDGSTQDATLHRDCPVPGAHPSNAAVASAHDDPDGEAGESSTQDGEANASDCDAH